MAGTSKLMAFGNRTNAMWIKAPLKGLVSPIKAVVGARELTNGQVTITRARLGRKHFDFVFKGNEVDLMPIRGFREGQYGNGPFMFNHPRALNGNLLPRLWSMPGMELSQRGNMAMDFYSASKAFGAPLSAQLNNPNAQPIAITGLTGAPTTGRCLWSPSNTAPVVPASYLTRPYYSLLVPPNYAVRITVWGAQNTGTTDPGLYYSLSNIPAATVAAGTKINPVVGGASVTVATSGVWRVLDLWIGAGSATALTNYTTFGAMDVRMALTTAPAQPTVFDYGRGQFPVMLSEDALPETLTRVGVSDSDGLSELDVSMEEVSQPW